MTKLLEEKELAEIRAWFHGPGTEQFQTGDVIAMLLDHIAHMREEEDFYYTLNGRLGKILNDTANALKGPPDELSLHSTHDLAKVATALKTERDALITARDDIGDASKRLIAERDSLSQRLAAAERDAALLWAHCHVTYWPPDGSYPIEHNPHARKDCRAMIEAALSSQEQKCETCGGSGRIFESTVVPEDTPLPCPTCSPSATEK